MWADNPLTAYLVLGLGNFLGGLTKGVTGFGSAILNLCTWILFVVCGVQSGTLQQAVICEALSSTLIAPGLLYVTRAHATADFKMVTAISLFVALSSPLGAAVLAKLDSKRVELVMGACLLAIILAEQLSRLLHLQRKQDTSSCNADLPVVNHHRQQQQLAEQQQQQQQQQEETVDDCTVCLLEDQASSDDLAAKAGGAAAGDNSTPAAGMYEPPAGFNDAAAANPEAGSDPQQPLLGGGPTTAATGSSSSSSSSRRWQILRSWLVVLGIGSIAGTLSGIMEGLTGMNGPPIMFMYRQLNTPKATVRGNNAWLNLLQMRLVPYWYMGLIVSQDLQLYAVSCSAGVVGVWLGDRLSHYINQKVFLQVLGVLMVLCCFLMFASGFGLIE